MNGTELKVTSQPLNANAGIMSLVGRLDSGNFEVLEDEVNRMIESGVNCIGIDASHLDGLSSAGLGAFANLATLLRERKGLFMLCSPVAEVVDLVDMLGLREMLGVTDTLDKAKAELLKPR